MASDEDWYCCDCNRYGTRNDIIQNHHNLLGHLVKQQTPIEKRIIVEPKGECLIKIKDEIIQVIPILQVFRSPFTNIEAIEHNELILPRISVRWEHIGSAQLSGNLKNLSRKLTFSAGQQSCIISENALETLFREAILHSNYEQTENKNAVVIRLTLSTSLESKPPNETSHWVCCSLRQIEALNRDETKVKEDAHGHPHVVTRQEIDEL